MTETSFCLKTANLQFTSDKVSHSKAHHHYQFVCYPVLTIALETVTMVPGESCISGVGRRAFRNVPRCELLLYVVTGVQCSVSCTVTPLHYTPQCTTLAGIMIGDYVDRRPCALSEDAGIKCKIFLFISCTVTYFYYADTVWPTKARSKHICTWESS